MLDFLYGTDTVKIVFSALLALNSLIWGSYFFVKFLFALLDND